METPSEEHDRLRAQREAIARKFGHKPLTVKRTVSPDCEGHSVPLAKRVSHAS